MSFENRERKEACQSEFLSDEMIQIVKFMSNGTHGI